MPTAFALEGDGGTCTRVDVAVGSDAADHNPCPHLRLEATAHTDAAGCSLKVNGVDLLSSCGVDRSAAYLNGGVCAAVVDSAAAPRAACFDTKTAGKGADQLGLTLALALTPAPTLALALPLTLQVEAIETGAPPTPLGRTMVEAHARGDNQRTAVEAHARGDDQRTVVAAHHAATETAGQAVS